MGLSLGIFIQLVLLEQEQPVTVAELTKLVNPPYRKATPESVSVWISKLATKGDVVITKDGRVELSPQSRARFDQKG